MIFPFWIESHNENLFMIMLSNVTGNGGGKIMWNMRYKHHAILNQARFYQVKKVNNDQITKSGNIL